MSDGSDKPHRIAILGGGPGGYPAAFLAAHLGFDVTLIDERAKPGGVCLNVGCIPSKALLHVARLVHESKEAAEWGVTFNDPKIDLNKLRKWKDQVITKLTGGLGAMAKQHKVHFVQGRGRFTDANHIKVTKTDGGTESVAFDSAIIATGSRPAMPGPLAIDSDRVMTSTEALDLPDIPKSLLVIGGGYIGLEMGTVYEALGSKVSVVEMTDGLLPGADRDLAEGLQKELDKRFDEILLSTRVQEMKEQKNGVKVSLSGLDFAENRVFEKVLVAVGRTPNTQDIGLDALGIEPNESGAVSVDERRRAGADNIYAIGDVGEAPALAHKATHEARVAVEAIAGEQTAFDPAAIPAVVFTDPEVAWAGLMETDCRKRGLDHKVVRFPWAASGRAATLGRSDGFTKLVVEPRSRRILGCGITGVGAGDLISEAALAIEMGATADDLALTIHPHPTMSETLMEAADLFRGHSPHYIPRK